MYTPALFFVLVVPTAVSVSIEPSNPMSARKLVCLVLMPYLANPPTLAHRRVAQPT